MATISLVDLPTEVLQQVAADLIGTHRLCLVSFASVNRLCRAVSLPVLFRTISIAISDDDHLRHGANALMDNPWILKHVRRLEIVAKSPPRQPLRDRGAGQPRGIQRRTDRSRAPDEDGSEDKEPPSQVSDLGLIGFAERAEAENILFNILGYRLNSDSWCHLYREYFYRRASRHKLNTWSLLVDLLEALPSLVDLVYDCEGTFPTPLFSIVRLLHPDCCLQITPFCLRDSDLEIFLRQRLESTRGPGCLTSLALGYRSAPIDAWSRRIDFGALRQLSLWGIYYDMEWDWMMRTRPFSSLEDLCLSDFSRPVPDGFFASFPPLKSLRFRGPMGHGHLDCILEQHGSSLASLHLDFLSFNPDFSFQEMEVRLIQERCPRLSHLEIPIRRSKSDSDEVAIYQVLGRIKHLQTLRLQFDWRYVLDHSLPADDLPVDNFEEGPDFDEMSYDASRNIWPGTVREAFLNTAVDARLAQDIWIALTSEGSGLKSLALHKTGDGGDLPELTRYMVWDDEADMRFINAFEVMLSQMSGHFFLQRSILPNDERVFATELERRWCPHQSDYERLEMGDVYTDKLMRIFHHIWPQKPGSRDWRDDWSSVPLEGYRGQNPGFVWVDRSCWKDMT